MLKQFHMHYNDVRYLHNISYEMLIFFSFRATGSATDYRRSIL